MSNAKFRVPPAVNEPVLDYAPGSSERALLIQEIQRQSAEKIEIPLVIGGEEVRTGKTAQSVCPHRHSHVLAEYHQADAECVDRAAKAARAAWRDWSETPWEHRTAIFLRAAELLASEFRMKLNASTMLGQSKTAHQAEIDAACELIDFFRFNAQYMQEIYEDQPLSSPGVWNRVEQRPLEGYVFAVTPFNFTSIAGNLPTAPALMGNTVLWKPASSAVFSAYYIVKLLERAGLPKGVINFLPGSGGEVGRPALAHADLAGVHFTGSTEVFRGMWKSIGDNIADYSCYPRIVGETGGKDFVFAHPSADVDALVCALVRGAFEYQGQKCSAASRAYIPASLWPRVEPALVDMVRSIRMGPTEDFTNFMGAVIDRGAFNKIKDYIETCRAAADADILAGGECDDSEGYFIQPTVVRAKDPRFKTMVEEIFGPVLTLYVYDDAKLDEALELCDTTSPYALTGAVFAEDRAAAISISNRLRHSAGNFYINDKPTGAVVGQQPFGGGRASGTNDKAGSKLNLLRWASTRTIKECLVPPTDYRYPYMAAD
ncbi:MAG: L-glutamate gamma-semialdehyde dehydrogenase [Planctomycetota bacterium]